MTDPSDIASVARGLTKAQREWVLSSDRTVEGIQPANEPDPEWDDMTRIGIAEYWTDRLTPLGLVVRDHLRAGGA